MTAGVRGSEHTGARRSRLLPRGAGNATPLLLAEDVAQTVGGGQRASAVMVAQLMFT